MRTLSVDVDKVISEMLDGAGTLSIRVIVCDGLNRSDYSMLKQVNGDWCWLAINAAYATEQMDGDTSWSHENDAIRAALLERRSVMVFDNLLEFCEWYVQTTKR